MANGTQAIDRAAELLALIVHAEDPRTFGDLVEETELVRSTASRVLNALERHQLIERDTDGAFHPGPLFAVYAARHDQIDAVIRTAQPIMARVNEETGEQETGEASRQRLERLRADLADKQEELNALNARWEQENTGLDRVGELMARLDDLRGQAERAQRDGDLETAARILYGEIPELTKELENASEEGEVTEGAEAMVHEEVGPELDLDADDMEQMAATAACAVARGTLEDLLERKAAQLGPEQPCPTCQRLCGVGRQPRVIEFWAGAVTYAEPKCHCPACRRDFFPSAPGLAAHTA